MIPHLASAKAHGALERDLPSLAKGSAQILDVSTSETRRGPFEAALKTGLFFSSPSLLNKYINIIYIYMLYVI